MDTIRIAGAQSIEGNDGQSSPTVAKEREAEGIRLLADWELALAGGGDDIPVWH